MNYLHSLLSIINEMSPFLLLGFFCAGILHVVVPRRFFKKYLSGNNFSSVLYASLFGIPLPLCSCGVIPTAMSLRREGASKAATSAFLTSTPQTGIDSILATFAVFGTAFTVMRPLAALATSLLVGWIVGICTRAEAPDAQEDLANKTDQPGEKGNWLLRSLKYGFYDMLQDIGGHLIVGLVIAGIITVVVPDSFFLQFADKPVLEMLAILVVAIPMYVCATGSIPIAAALMIKGISPGAALVFLMAGPATNIASLMVINKVLGRKTMWIYLVGIVLGAMAFGLAIDLWMPAEWFSAVQTHESCCQAPIPLWKWIATGVFMVLLLNALVGKRMNRQKNKISMKNVTVYHVGGMSCNHCKSSVETNLGKIEGVEAVEANLSDGHVTVTGMVDDNRVKEVIESIGFEYKGRL